MSTVAEIEAAIEKLAPKDLRELSLWLVARLQPAESAQMLAAIDEAERSLAQEGGVPVEEVRRTLRKWITA